MRFILLASYLCFVSVAAMAQGRISMQSDEPTAAKTLTSRQLTPYSITVRGGLTQFFGELGEQDMRGMAGFSLNQKVQRAFTMGLDFSTGKLGGEKTEFFNSYFVADYRAIDLLAKWDLTEQFSRYDDEKLHISVYGGIGMMYFRSNAYDLTTNQRVRFTNSDVSGRNPLFLRWGNPRGRLGVTRTAERTIPLGVAFDYQLARTWQLGLDYRFYFARTDKLDATSGRRLTNPEEGTSYSDTPNDKFSFLALSLTHRFTRKPKDSDGDGIPDDRDRCPDVPGTSQFFGCPDSDGDGIPDYVDRCPQEAGPVATRGCPDTDGDGFIDRLDECPTVAGTLRGCPDRDGDGVYDQFDACPDVPGLVRFGGCPDTDGDGIPDPSDLCPDKPGTYENGGCPDTDGDGVHDGIDRCPEVPGTRENDGCPSGQSQADRLALQQRLDSLLTVPIRFATDTDVIDEASYRSLNAIGDLIKRYSALRFIVEGHTDNTGSEEVNQRLSEGRARAVRQYLISRGTEEERISAIGFGDARPVAPNNTEEGRARNRRVVIRVLE
ncbi:hypothetical protein GCM10027275_00450 [Rhabdobacter roseus]